MWTRGETLPDSDGPADALHTLGKGPGALNERGGPSHYPEAVDEGLEEKDNKL